MQQHSSAKALIELLKETCRNRLQVLGVPAFAILVSAQDEKNECNAIEGDNAVTTILWNNAAKAPDKWQIIGNAATALLAFQDYFHLVCSGDCQTTACRPDSSGTDFSTRATRWCTSCCCSCCGASGILGKQPLVRRRAMWRIWA